MQTNTVEGDVLCILILLKKMNDSFNISEGGKH